MRVRINGSKTVVRLHHFRYCAKHIKLLLGLQAETPSLVLTAESSNDKYSHVLVSDLLLDYEELRFLNPSEAV